MAIDVRDDADRHRYEVTVDGELAGFAQYRDVDGARVFTHTEVFDAYEGRGLGSRLAAAALDDVRAAGHRLVALCPFVDRYVRDHPAYADLVDHELDQRLRG
ncbi:MAG TPA: GNAT family N-acetyltransferase [Acidimicrobiales bacterium]